MTRNAFCLRLLEQGKNWLQATWLGHAYLHWMMLTTILTFDSMGGAVVRQCFEVRLFPCREAVHIYVVIQRSTKMHVLV